MKRRRWPINFKISLGGWLRPLKAPVPGLRCVARRSLCSGLRDQRSNLYRYILLREARDSAWTVSGAIAAKLTITSCSYTTVDGGHRAIIFSRIGWVQNEIYTEGLHFRWDQELFICCWSTFQYTHVRFSLFPSLAKLFQIFNWIMPGSGKPFFSLPQSSLVPVPYNLRYQIQAKENCVPHWEQRLVKLSWGVPPEWWDWCVICHGWLIIVPILWYIHPVIVRFADNRHAKGMVCRMPTWKWFCCCLFVVVVVQLLLDVTN